MGYAELFEKFQTLPLEKQAEVVDFVEFLALRFGRDRPTSPAPDEWTDAEFAELAMGQALRGMEDEPALYGAEDLKERWQ